METKDNILVDMHNYYGYVSNFEKEDKILFSNEGGKKSILKINYYGLNLFLIFSDTISDIFIEESISLLSKVTNKIYEVGMLEEKTYLDFMKLNNKSENFFLKNVKFKLKEKILILQNFKGNLI